MKNILKKRINYIIIAIVLFVAINVALSFAYIRGGSVGSESVSTVALTGGSVNVKYSGGEAITANSIVPGYQATKKFTITSEYGKGHEYFDSGLWYQINLVVDKNEFGDGSLKYSLSLDAASDDDGVPATNVEYVGIPSGRNLTGIAIGSGKIINDQKSHIYNLKIDYAETGIDQSDEIGKSFEARITLTNPQVVRIILQLDGGEISVPGYNPASSSLTSAQNSLYTLPIAYKSGYSFNGWKIVSGNATLNGNVLSVNKENVTVKANYKVQSFATDTWEEIAFNVRHGATDGYKIGDTREVAVEDYQNTTAKPTFTVRVANKISPDECNQNGFSQTACGFVVEFVDLVAKKQLYPSNTNKGGWPDTAMRKYLNESFIDLLPIDLKQVIADTDVVSSHGNQSGATNYTSTDKLYLLSTVEIYGVALTDTVTETRQLDYYTLNQVSSTSSALSKPAIKKFAGTATGYWTRTAVSSSATNYKFVYSAWNSSNGATSSTGASTATYAYAPAFRIIG